MPGNRFPHNFTITFSSSRSVQAFTMLLGSDSTPSARIPLPERYDDYLNFVSKPKKLFCIRCSTDESLTSSYHFSAHSSHHQQQSLAQMQHQQHHHHPHQMQMQQMPQMQLQTTAITSSTSIPHAMSSNMYQPSVMQTAGPSGLVQSLSHTQPLEQLAYTEEFFPPTAGIDEQYIYVTYPTEMKKRMSDRYDRETLLMLTNDYGEF
jgi:hypothetical protein